MPGVVVFNNTAPSANQNDVSASFQVPVTGSYLLYAAGSGWVSGTGLIQVTVSLNNNAIGTASVWSNEAESHKSVVPLAAIVSLNAGQNSAAMAAAQGTNVDFNDLFTLTLVAL